MLVAGKHFLDPRPIRAKVECLSRIDLNGMIAPIDFFIAQDDSRDPRLDGERCWAGHDDADAWCERDKDLWSYWGINNNSNVMEEAVPINELSTG